MERVVQGRHRWADRVNTPRASITEILKRARDGDGNATDELFPLVYADLKRLAAGIFRRQHSGHTWQPTVLVHEAYLRLVNQAESDVASRAHFFALAARVMRQALVDHARENGAKKRGADRLRVTLEEGIAVSLDSSVDLLDLEEALRELQGLDARKAEVVELRFFGGLTIAEAARVLDVSPKTVEADWYAARAWLRGRLGAD